MIYNTMRFNTDIFQFEEDIMPTLCFRINGATTGIPLSATASKPAVAIRIGGGIFYAALCSPTDSEASKVRIKINGTVYALKG